MSIRMNIFMKTNILPSTVYIPSQLSLFQSCGDESVTNSYFVENLQSALNVSCKTRFFIFELVIFLMMYDAGEITCFQSFLFATFQTLAAHSPPCGVGFAEPPVHCLQIQNP